MRWNSVTSIFLSGNDAHAASHREMRRQDPHASKADVDESPHGRQRQVRRSEGRASPPAQSTLSPQGIGITVTDGVVTLTGTVRTIADIERIATAAIAVSGVVHVRSDGVTCVDRRDA
jgi:BON domain